MDQDGVGEAVLRDWLCRNHPEAAVARLDRLRGGSKKGVHRISFADESSAVLYVWADSENFWINLDDGKRDAPNVFDDASGPDLFLAALDQLRQIDVRTPRLLAFERQGSEGPVAIALVEDVPGGTLETALTTAPEIARHALPQLAEMLTRMHAVTSDRIGRVNKPVLPVVPCERLATKRAEADLAYAAKHVLPVAESEDRLREILRTRLDAVQPRQEHGLIHGELGPDHVLLTNEGAPVLIDIEGLMFFDIEWEHAFLRLRFGDQYEQLYLAAGDEHRMRLYALCLHLSLISGPLRLLAGSSFPDQEGMRTIVRANVNAVLALVR